jgi:hypothetical protein
MVQNSVYVARGLLVESKHPVWLYGTSSEHSIFYQYNFHNAANVFAGMIQTESPYYQPTPPPPAPFQAALGVFPGDPAFACNRRDPFDGCDESWALVIRGSSEIFIAGAGLYSWFSTYAQTCIDGQLCQRVLILLDDNFINVRIQHLITIGAKYIAVHNGVGIPAIDNLNVQGHPRWSQISVLDVANNGSNYLWVDPAIWDMAQPAFTCSPPCMVKLPPWTKATSTVNYPVITVSQGAWTSTITSPPLTISEWVFKPVTLEVAAAAVNGKIRKRQGFEAFTPALATTPVWPGIRFLGPDGLPTVTSPSGPFPTPPPAPLQGAWLSTPVQPVQGQQERPMVAPCLYFDPDCITPPWLWGAMPDDPYEDNERGPEDDVTCPSDPTSTSSAPPGPSPSPREGGNPQTNHVDCYNSGRATSHDRMYNTISSFCRNLEGQGDLFSPEFEYSFPFELPTESSGVTVINMRMKVLAGCEWRYNFDECTRYLRVPVDSCNCGGVNGKQGGVLINNCYMWKIDPNTKL